MWEIPLIHQQLHLETLPSFKKTARLQIKTDTYDGILLSHRLRELCSGSLSEEISQAVH